METSERGSIPQIEDEVISEKKIFRQFGEEYFARCWNAQFKTATYLWK